MSIIKTLYQAHAFYTKKDISAPNWIIKIPIWKINREFGFNENLKPGNEVQILGFRVRIIE